MWTREMEKQRKNRHNYCEVAKYTKVQAILQTKTILAVYLQWFFFILFFCHSKDYVSFFFKPTNV